MREGDASEHIKTDRQTRKSIYSRGKRKYEVSAAEDKGRGAVE